MHVTLHSWYVFGFRIRLYIASGFRLFFLPPRTEPHCEQYQHKAINFDRQSSDNPDEFRRLGQEARYSVFHLLHPIEDLIAAESNKGAEVCRGWLQKNHVPSRLSQTSFVNLVFVLAHSPNTRPRCCRNCKPISSDCSTWQQTPNGSLMSMPMPTHVSFLTC